MRRSKLAAAALAVAVAGVGSAGAASAAAGTGVVVDTLVATVAAGPLTLAGTGASVALSPTPGVFTASTGATVLTVSDLTGTTNGWAITATYSDPVAGNALGGANVKVSAGSVTGALPSSAVTLANDVALSSPVTVATTGTGTGTGVTAVTSSYKVKVPADAVIGEVYGATVTYTLASVR